MRLPWWYPEPGDTMAFCGLAMGTTYHWPLQGYRGRKPQFGEQGEAYLKVQWLMNLPIAGREKG